MIARALLRPGQGRRAPPSVAPRRSVSSKDSASAPGLAHNRIAKPKALIHQMSAFLFLDGSYRVGAV